MNNPLIPVVQQPAAANHRPHNITMIRVILDGKHRNGAEFVMEKEDFDKETFCKFI